jgi:hypothetical protein
MVTKLPNFLSRNEGLRRWPKVLVSGVVLALAVQGCVSKATARKQAQQAYIAGQQHALQMMQQQQLQQGTGIEQGLPRTTQPTVTLLGSVRKSSVPWTSDLTLAKALVEGEYTGSSDPTEIYIVRGGLARPVDPAKLIGGQDVPLQAGDVVQVK